MKTKNLWLILLIVLVPYIIVQSVYFLNTDLTSGFGIMLSAIELLSALIMVFSTGLILGLLFACIPFKEMTYKRKLNATFPISTLAITLLITGYFSYLVYLGIDLRPVHQYEDIRTPEGLNCSSVHNGVFEVDNIIIERSGNHQRQTDKKTGEVMEFSVEWLNDCEYRLTPEADTTDGLRAKITAVNSDSYGCYVIYDRSSKPYAKFYNIKRLNK